MRVLIGGGKTRQSNIELLRIIAMLLVMVVHADFFSLGAPSPQDIQTSPLPAVTRIFIQSLSICCVNVFVLISGYFGIRPKQSSLVRFIYQIIFFSCSIYAAFIAFGLTSVTLNGLLQCVYLTPANWFVKAYLLLFIIAPALNAFVDLKNRRLHRNILIGFFLMQSIYGCLFAANFFEGGYSTLSFIGLYLLGRYIYVYKPSYTTYRAGYDILTYIACAVVLTVSSMAFAKLHKNYSISVFTYINPIVIVQSVALLLFFSKQNLQSKTVNWLAASAFAVYLLHANPNILSQYKQTVEYIYIKSSGAQTLLFIGFYIFAVFALSVVVDQVRKISYEFILKEIRNRRVESRHL